MIEDFYAQNCPTCEHSISTLIYYFCEGLISAYILNWSQIKDKLYVLDKVHGWQNREKLSNPDYMFPNNNDV